MINILKGGCGTRHSSSYRMSRPEGLANYVLLIIHTQSEFMIDGKYFSVTPGHAVIITPHTPYAYSNPYGDYIDDWLHFEPSDDCHAASFLKKKIPAENTPFYFGSTDTFTFLIRQLLYECSYTDPEYASENINALFNVLLNHLSAAFNSRNDSCTASPFRRELQLLRLELQNCCSRKYTIEECASRLHISPSYFQHLYSKLFGISFRQDVIKMRIEQAKYVMSTTDLSLREISELCGYSSEVHFYRQFKQEVKITPAKYRRGIGSHI